MYTLLLHYFITSLYAQHYSVSIIEITQYPIVSFVDGTSDFQQIYNPTYVMASSTLNTTGLIMQSQNCTSNTNGTCIYCDGKNERSSKLTFVECNYNTTNCSDSSSNKINNNSVIFSASSQFDILGIQGPRISYNKLDDYYYMFYTSHGYGNSTNTSQETDYLSLAKTKYPNKNDSWIKYGKIFQPDGVEGSKSGALLIESDRNMKDYGYNYLYWSSNHDTSIKITDSKRITNWTYTSKTTKTFMEPRMTAFDNGFVESGPPPVQLENVFDTNGAQNYIFFYNSANKNSTGQIIDYNVGFVIIDKFNKKKIVQRSDAHRPLLSPTYTWEQGLYPYSCNVPNMVFVEGAVIMTEKEKMEYIKMKGIKGMPKDLIRIYFGGANAVVGTAVVQVTYG